MNEQKLLLKFQFLSTLFSLILGTLLHFSYNWSGNNIIVSLFSSVNESTWEHLKLAFFPMLISGTIGYFIFKDDFPNFLCSKAIGICIALAFTVIFFYTYTGILGTNYAFLNISSFVLAIVIGEYTTYKLILNNIPCNKINYSIILILLTIAFILFTFTPPRINLFKDPISNSYGIQKSF